MYKAYLKQIFKQEKLLLDLHKNADEKPNSVKNQQPHFIFSAENPAYPDKKRLNMKHDDVLSFLKDRGYNAEEMHGSYGEPEKSIIVHSPPKHSVRHLMNLSSKLGQECSIYSDGYNHEMHYHHGENAGLHHKGQGTDFHKKPPEDFYSSLGDTHFTHQFNFDETHDPKSSQLSILPDQQKINKSERPDGRFILKKNENDEHPFENTGPDTKLIHYSPQENIEKIDPEKHGTRGIGSETKYGTPKNKLTFFYGEGVKPESVVTDGAKSKYVTSLGHKKLYDLAKDPDGIRSKLKEEAKDRQVNPGIVDKDELHDSIREAGYHGIYNSNLNPQMSRVVGMFEPMEVEAEHPIHPKDFHETTAYNHHQNDERREKARDFARETGHHSPKFLSKLKTKVGQS